MTKKIKYTTMMHPKQHNLLDIPRTADKAKPEEGKTTMQTEINMESQKPTTKPSIVVDFEGKFGQERKRQFVEPDAYTATIVGVSDIFVSKNPFNQEDESKLVINFELPVKDKTGDSVKLGLFLRAKITHSAKSSKGYSDSKLYELLEKAGGLERCKAFWQEASRKENPEKALVDFLKQEFLGRQVKLIPKTIVSKEGEKYSVISEIVKFVDTPQESSESKPKEELVN